MKIDLKNARLIIRDGKTASPATGAVNLTAGYAAGAVAMDVDGIIGAVVVGTSFKVVGSNWIHTVTDTTETSTDTTNIVFTPGLSAAVLDDAVITFGPNAIEVKLGDGTLTYSEKQAREYVLDRGTLDTVRNGDDQPVDVSFSFTWEWIKSAMDAVEPVPSVEDALKQSGGAAAWESSSADTCEPYAVDLVFIHAPVCTTNDIETIVLSDFRYESLDHDAKAGTVSCTGKCNVTTATVTRG